MPEVLRARLNGTVSQAEASLMWESERTTFTTATGDEIDSTIFAPEMVIRANGEEVTLSFPSGGDDSEHNRIRVAFENAVRRYRPELRVEWLDRTMKAG